MSGLEKCLDDNKHLLDYVLFVTPHDKQQSILSLVCTLGLLDVVRVLDAKNVLRNIMDADGYSPLHRAAYNQHVELVKYLTECFGCNALLDISLNGFNTLHIAASLGVVDLVRFVAQNTTDIDALCENGWNALHIAAHAGFTKVGLA